MFCNHYKIDSDKKLLIGFAGAPSTGKDTMADVTRMALSNSSHKVHEFAREYIEKHGSTYSNFQQHIIWEKQVELEECARKTYQVVFSSSPRFLSFIYASMLMPSNPQSADYANLSDLFDKATRGAREYDYLFVCEPFGKMQQDGLRFQEDADILVIHQMIGAFLTLLSVPYTLLPGQNNNTVEERLSIIMETIGAKLL